MHKISKISVAILVSISLLFASTAFGVTKVSTSAEESDMGVLNSSLSERAESDIQIRKLKNLMLSEKIDIDEAFEKLETLQKSSRVDK